MVNGWAAHMLVAAEPTSSDPSAELPILPHTGELIFGLVSFAILYWIIKSKVFPRLETVYAQRVAAIEGGMAQAQLAQEQAAAALQSYQNQLARAHDEAHNIRERAKEDATAQANEIRTQAQSEAERIVASGHQQVAADRQQAAVQLRSQVGQLSVDLAERIVGQSLTEDATQAAVVDRMLADLEAAQRDTLADARRGG